MTQDSVAHLQAGHLAKKCGKFYVQTFWFLRFFVICFRASEASLFTRRFTLLRAFHRERCRIRTRHHRFRRLKRHLWASTKEKTILLFRKNSQNICITWYRYRFWKILSTAFNILPCCRPPRPLRQTLGRGPRAGRPWPPRKAAAGGPQPTWCPQCWGRWLSPAPAPPWDRRSAGAPRPLGYTWGSKGQVQVQYFWFSLFNFFSKIYDFTILILKRQKLSTGFLKDKYAFYNAFW